jgi:UDP-N-acetylmuramyl pentapeptide phosphotransferase/UDP-N-acetylglucosamine-1-phosphate transferase
MEIFFAPFLSTLVVCGLLIHFQSWHLRLSADNNFDGPQKFHTRSTPRIGGVGIFIGLLVPVVTLIFSNDDLAISCFYLMLASLPVFIAGLTEDLTKVVGVKWRLVAGFLSGIAFLTLFDIDAIRLDIIYLDALLQNPWITLLFLSIAIAGLSNAYNIIDGFNGLASMVGIISLLAILYVASQVGDSLVITLAMIGIAAIAGFFLWNYPRGLLFLGDSGAYLIGFWIACASILLVVRHTSVSPWFALMVNAYPIFETLFTMWRRSVHQGKSMGCPDGAHFHSLIYRRVMRWAHEGDSKTHVNLRNSKTSPVLWILSSLGVVPAALWWNSSTILMVSALFFILLYVYLYRKIVRFRTPRWLGRPS